MSKIFSLHTYVGARFREAFGAPSTTMGRDDHWRLQGSPSQLPINVLLNGTRDIPALWVFDAHDLGDGVFSAAITNRDQVEDLIVEIQSRVQRADSPPTIPVDAP
jgi:hypothetical protein